MTTTRLHLDSPEVRELVGRAFPEYRGRKFTVEVFCGPMRLDSYWSGGTRDYWAMVRMADGKAGYVPENGTPWNPGLGALEALPEGMALVRWTRGSYESVCVYVGEVNMTKLLPPPVELTCAEKIVLAATSGLKSSYAGIKNYRFHEANRYTKITLAQWEEAKAKCTERGFLNKAGAITDAGRNALGGLGSQMLHRLRIERKVENGGAQ